MDDASAQPAFNCPRCGQPMENGLVRAGKGLRFLDEEENHNIILKVFGGETVISEWQMAGTAAWDCAACHLAVVDYSENA